jgi:predicted MFS family arabinose efflux permease
MTEVQQTLPGWRLYLIWGLLAFSYAIAFFQRVAPQAIVDLLRLDFATTPQGIGALASGYFYGYMFMQIPTGVLVHTFSTKRLMIASLLASIVGTITFSASHDIWTAFFARLLVALGDSLVFMCILKLVAEQFPANRFGLISGLSQVSGYAGGLAAATPLALAAGTFGWRACFFWVAVMVLATLIGIIFAMPRPRQLDVAAERGSEYAHHMWTALLKIWIAIRTREAWGCALTFVAHFAPVTSLSGVWAIPMLMNAYGLDRTQASQPMSMFMLATMAGSVGVGYLSDRIQSVFKLLLISCGLRIVLLGAIAPTIGSQTGTSAVSGCIVAFGLIAGGTLPLILKATKILYTPAAIGIGTAINCTLAGLIAGVAQPVIGWLLEVALGGDLHTIEHGKVAAGYDLLILLLIAITLLGIVGPLMMRRRLIEGFALKL